MYPERRYNSTNYFRCQVFYILAIIDVHGLAPETSCFPAVKEIIYLSKLKIVRINSGQTPDIVRTFLTSKSYFSITCKKKMKFFSENISKKSCFLVNSQNRYHIGYTNSG